MSDCEPVVIEDPLDNKQIELDEIINNNPSVVIYLPIIVGISTPQENMYHNGTI